MNYIKPQTLIKNELFMAYSTYAFNACPRRVSNTPGSVTCVSSPGPVVGRRLSLGHSVLSGAVQVGDDCGEVTVATVGHREERGMRRSKGCSAEIHRLFAARHRDPL